MKEHRICVALSYDNPYYDRVYVLVRALLSAYEIDENVWSINFHDFLTLKKRMDMMGLVDGRTVNEDAYTWIMRLEGIRERNRSIKTGINNKQVREYLENRIKTLPYEDQLSAISYAVNNRRSGIFDDTGWGKTLEALAAIVALGDKVRRTLIICPYTVQIGFTREIQIHTDLTALAVPSGRKKALQFIQDSLNDAWDILLVHPENLIGGSGKSNIQGDITKLLRSMIWDMIIVDEFHQYKNYDVKRTQCVLSLLNDTRDRAGYRPRAMLLTGTPVSESPMNAYVALRVLSQDLIPHITKFENHFVTTKQVSHRKRGSKSGEKVTYNKVTGYKNLEELKVMLGDVSIRRTKGDMQGFPDKIFKIRDVELSGKQLTLYKTICGEIVKELTMDQSFNLQKLLTKTTKILRLRQLMNHPSLLELDGDSAKYLECDSVLEEVLSDPEQKVLIWTEYRKAVENLYERYNPMYGAVKIYGGVSNEQLRDIAFEFEHKDTPRVAVCIPAKAGTGVDFLARARTAIYIDRPYSYTLYTQSIDRIHRRIARGDNISKLDRIRAQPATLIFLDVVNSVDVLVREALSNKKNMADALMIANEKLVEIGRADLLNYLRYQ